MMTLDADRPDAAVRWRGDSNSEILTQGLHSVLATPVIIDGYIYGVGSYGQLRCLDAATGERIWETQAVTVERARWASAFLVRHEDRFFINNDRGDLIIARMTPAGYEELSRTHLIAPTSEPGNRRELDYGQLVTPRLRQPAHLRPQRRGDHRRFAGGAVAARRAARRHGAGFPTGQHPEPSSSQRRPRRA